MAEPLIVVSKFRVKEGKLEDLAKYYKKVLEIVTANEPQLIAFHGFLNEDGTEMTVPKSTLILRLWTSTCKCSGTTGMSPSANMARCSKPSASSTTGRLPKVL
jgi:hypothetical protein